jgi:putative transcriptional regulator
MKNRIRDLRAEHQITQEQLAAMVAVSRQAIIAIESDKYDPGLPLAFKIARAFGEDVEAVFIWEEGRGMKHQLNRRRKPLRKAG